MTLGEGIALPTLEAAPITAIYITTRSDLFAFELASGSRLEMTRTHPVWCEARSQWVSAGELKVGDRIRTAAGPACVSSISLARAGATVYNLSVAGGATFFVGEDGAWVHNFDAKAAYWKCKYSWIKAPERIIEAGNIYAGRLERFKVIKQVHHIHPQRGGGTDDLDNLQEVWPWEHEALDGSFHWPYQLERTITDIPEH